MNENEEIISLLKSINKHLEELDESMLHMKSDINYISTIIEQKEEDAENQAIYEAAYPELYEDKKPENIEAILSTVKRLNENIVIGTNNQIRQQEKLRDILDEMKDDINDYYLGLKRTIEALRERMF